MAAITTSLAAQIDLHSHAGSVIYRVADSDGFALVVGDNGYMQASWQQGILPGPLYNAANMRRCLSWIKEQEQSPACLGILCAHDPRNLNIAEKQHP